jgi:hypothetical protein
MGASSDGSMIRHRLQWENKLSGIAIVRFRGESLMNASKEWLNMEFRCPWAWLRIFFNELSSWVSYRYIYKMAPGLLRAPTTPTSVLRMVSQLFIGEIAP